jgi:DNA-binding MarR family transcriptional regulator
MSISEIIRIRTKELLDFLMNNPEYELNSREWLVFLTVAIEEGVTTPELVEQLQVPQQTISRKVRNLGQTVNKAGELEGYNLIRIVPKGKTHSLFLTDSGKELWHAYSEMHSKVDDIIIEQYRKDNFKS